MPTRAGWLALVGGLAIIAVGRLFGLRELFVVGAGILVCLGAALLAVRFRPVKLRVSRRVTPLRVHAGETARVELLVANRTRLRMPMLALRDPVSSTQGARLQLAPLAPGASTRAAYRLPTTRRGRIVVGPLTLVRSDVLGLAAKRVEAASSTTVTVLPGWQLVAVPGTGGDRGALGQHLRMRALGRSGDEFRSMRDYVPGDDLRRINWRASARAGELKVRENEVAGLRNLAVILDLDAAAHTPASFERAVSAATSIVISAAERGRDVRFLTTAGFEMVPGALGVDGLLEHLAVVEPVEGAAPDRALGGLASRINGGLLVLVGGRLTPMTLSALRGAAVADATVAVACEGPSPRGAAGVFVVDATEDGTFAAAWNLLVGVSDGGGGVDHRSARPEGAIVLGTATV